MVFFLVSELRRGATIPETWLSACRTRRDGETRVQSRCVPLECGQATGTFPRVHPIRAHRWNRCGRRCHSRARTRSCPVSRACTWPRRFRSWPRIPRQALGSCAIATFERSSLRAAHVPAPRDGSCIQCLPCAVAPR